MNDSPVGCQNCELTEPQRDKLSAKLTEEEAPRPRYGLSFGII